MARILVADDAADVRSLVEAVLVADGHDVVTVVDGLEALHRYRTESFDVICSDLDMSGLNGAELMRAVRSDPGGEIPILLVSGSGSPQDIPEAHEAGISAFLEKPFSISDLRNQVRAVLKRIHADGSTHTATTDSRVHLLMSGSSERRLSQPSADGEVDIDRSPTNLEEVSTRGQALSFLVVDDNQDIRDVFCRLIERAGHVGSTAVDGQEAVEMLERQSFDIMLLDLTMPRMDGVEVVRWIRAHPDVSPQMRIVVISAWAAEHRGVLQELGVDTVMSKPLRLQQLTDLIAEGVLDPAR